MPRIKNKDTLARINEATDAKIKKSIDADIAKTIKEAFAWDFPAGPYTASLREIDLEDGSKPFCMVCIEGPRGTPIIYLNISDYEKLKKLGEENDNF